MTKIKKCALLVVALMILAGCTGKTSSIAMVGAGYPDPASSGALLFKGRCSECHVPPLPVSRKAKDWPLIVKRMQGHRIMNNFAPITDDEMRYILDYLQKYSAG